ncbi:glycosyltransferase family 2 protein [uncultured Chloroflexus sp.]|uniref:glycosyltransferase family 2 protein n=1 Tax=uncultured Chloroflexus sp. TaxID=214040 RepID=UPI00261B9D94|nr:glycosyltransferase family 2 protein [uncultured Chloroflexus sp.]
MNPLAAEYPTWVAYAHLTADLPPPPIRDPAQPLVSIVVPSLNQGRYIGETLNSILTQDYPNLEIWVIDGGSSDETPKVLRAFAGDERVQLVVGNDAGQADAINRGWARARGSVLAWLNSDDTYLPGAIATQVAALQAHPAAVAVYADARYTDAQGQPLYTIAARPYHPLALLRLLIPMQPTVFLRRTAVGLTGPLDVRMRYALDTAYWVRLAQLGPFQPTSTVVATYRLHAASKTVTQFAGFYREWLQIAEQSFTVMPELSPARREVLADIYAAMTNLEARNGSLRTALRYAAYTLTLAGWRPRLAKTPLVLLDRWLGSDLAERAGSWWGRQTRR